MRPSLVEAGDGRCSVTHRLLVAAALPLECPLIISSGVGNFPAFALNVPIGDRMNQVLPSKHNDRALS